MNAVAPGLIATPMSQRAQSDAQIRAYLQNRQPLTGQPGKPEDVAQAILYLSTAPFVTGVVLEIAGRSSRWCERGKPAGVVCSRRSRGGDGRQILIGGDLARRSYWKHHGDPFGFTFIPLRVPVMLAQAGLTAAQINDILVQNPRSFWLFAQISRCRRKTWGKK